MEKQKMIKAWVAKYALTKGIFEVDAVLICKYGHITYCRNLYANKGQWAYTREEAVKLAYEIKRKKIDLLKRNIDKISAIEFE